jgi:hypothetical protein
MIAKGLLGWSNEIHKFRINISLIGQSSSSQSPLTSRPFTSAPWRLCFRIMGLSRRKVNEVVIAVYLLGIIEIDAMRLQGTLLNCPQVSLGYPVG